MSSIITIPEGIDRLAYLMGFVRAEELARRSGVTKEPVKPTETAKAVETKESAKPVEPKEPAKPVETKEPAKPVEPKEPSKPAKQATFAALASEMPSDAAQAGKVVEVKASQLGAFLRTRDFLNAKKVTVPANKIGQMIETYGGLGNFLMSTTDRVPQHHYQVDESNSGFWAKGTVLVRTSTGQLVMLETTNRKVASFIEKTAKYVPKGAGFKISESLTDPGFFIGLTPRPCQDGPETPFVWGLNKFGIPFNWLTVMFSWTVEKDDEKHEVKRVYYIMPTPDSKSVADQKLSKYAVYRDGRDWRVVQWNQDNQMYVGCTIGAVYNAMYCEHPEKIQAKLNPQLSDESLTIIRPKIFNAYENGLQDAQKALGGFKTNQAEQSNEDDASSVLSEGWQPAK